MHSKREPTHRRVVGKTMGFCTFQKSSILTPLYLSFSLVFFPSVTGAETRPDSRGLRHSADPFWKRHMIFKGEVSRMVSSKIVSAKSYISTAFQRLLYGF